MAISYASAEISGLLTEESQSSVSHAVPGRLAGIAAWAGLLCWACIATGLLVHDRISPKLPTSAQANIEALISEDGESSSLYSFFTDKLKGAKYIDLTHPFGPDSPVWPGFGPATFGPAVAGADMEGFIKKGEEFKYGEHGFQAGTYSITTDQYGTQLDPPAHWNEFGATTSDLPATFALRPLVVLDVHEKVQENKSYHASVGDAKAWEEAHGKIPEGSVVMVRSDWGKDWDKYKKDGLPSEYAGVDLKLLQFLHNDRSILFHGHEPLDTDMTPSLEGEAWLMHSNFAQAEGVTNLDKVPEFGCLVSIGFAKTLGGLGGYARYIAICPSDTQAGVTFADAPGAPLPEQKHPLRRNSEGVMVPDASADDDLTEYCSGKASLGCADGKAVWK